MSDDHEWCQDVPRDEAVRAAEDAAAVPSIQHRDLPEQVALLWASVGDLIGRVVRLEGEMDAGQDEAEEAAPAGDPAFPGEGMRTERVTLEIVQRGTQAYTPIRSWPWDEILEDWAIDRRGESVRVVDDVQEKRLNDRGELCTARQLGDRCTDLANILLKRDREIGTLKSRVAELEQQIKLDDRWAAAAPAANAGGEAKQEPVAWGCRYVTGDWHPCIYISHELAGRSCPHNGTVVPLYAAPPEPRGWLTKNERAAVESARDYFAAPEHDDDECAFLAAALCGLLARSSPPRVRRPKLQDHLLPQAQRDRDDVWIEAIRVGGGEVEG